MDDARSYGCGVAAFDAGLVSSLIAILIRRDDGVERSCWGCWSSSKEDFLCNNSCVVLRSNGAGGDCCCCSMESDREVLLSGGVFSRVDDKRFNVWAVSNTVDFGSSIVSSFDDAVSIPDNFCHWFFDGVERWLVRSYSKS